MIILDDTDRRELSKPLIRILAEVIFFSITGLLIGISLGYIFPSDTILEESGFTSFLWLIVQLIINAVIIYVFDKSYLMTFGNDSDEYIGMTIFTYILLIAQTQIFNRIRNVYFKTTGKTINRNNM